MNSYNVHNNPLAVVCNEGYWRVSNMSPMYNFQYDVARLKQYALITANNLVTSSICFNINLVYCGVFFEQLPPLKSSSADPYTLMITVVSPLQQIKYRALLVSWGVSEPVDNSIHLPFMLERGEAAFSTMVKYTLRILFGCEIIPNYFTQHQLMLFTIHFLENDNANNTDVLIISYRSPNSSHNYTLNLSVEIVHMRAMWNGIKNVFHDVQGAVSSLYHLLLNEVRYRMPPDFPELHISKVTLPEVEVTNCGVEIKTPEFVDSVFTVLNKTSTNLHFYFDNLFQ